MLKIPQSHPISSNYWVIMERLNKMKLPTLLEKNLNNCSETFYVDDTNSYTYQQAFEQVKKFIKVLTKIKKKSGQEKLRVAVITDKSFLGYCVILAIIISGNIWIPIDKGTPVERRQVMLRKVIPHVIFQDIGYPSDSDYQTLGLIEEEGGSLFWYVNNDVPHAQDSMTHQDTCMIFFTSGSTGIPKAVQISATGVTIFIQNITAAINFGKGQVFGDYHSTSFVISVPIIMIAVSCQGTLCPAMNLQEQVLPNSSMNINNVSTLITVPSTMKRILQGIEKGRKINRIDNLLLCGEPLPVALFKSIIKYELADKIFNCYGSTEGCVWNFIYNCSTEDITKFNAVSNMPIGSPLPKNFVKIDKNGELLISGMQISPGYLGEPLNGAFKILNKDRFYSTGDIVEEHKRVYFCKGRLDSNIKVNGYRVSLLDVESNINNLSGVTGSVCFFFKNQIHAVVFHKTRTSEKMIREGLLKKLPAYMVPRKILLSKTLLLNKNGKIDRSAVREMLT